LNFDEAVTSILDAIAVLAIAAGAAVAVAVSGRIGAAIATGGAALLCSTILLGWLAQRAAAYAARRDESREGA
jgi:hypothetical protein